MQQHRQRGLHFESKYREKSESFELNDQKYELLLTNLREAIEVPEIVLTAVLDVCQADLILEPGAKISTQPPQLLKLLLLSDEVEEATVIAVSSEAGDELHASAFSFPAATTMTTPA